MKDDFEALRIAEAQGRRIQAWHLNEDALSSADGFWDTLHSKAEFDCPVHLYRVHPEDV